MVASSYFGSPEVANFGSFGLPEVANFGSFELPEVAKIAIIGCSTCCSRPSVLVHCKALIEQNNLHLLKLLSSNVNPLMNYD